MVFVEIAIVYLVQQLAQHYSANDYVDVGDGGNGNNSNAEGRDDDNTTTARGKQAQQVSGGIHLEPDDQHPHDYVASERNTSSTRRSSTTTTKSTTAASDVRDDNESLKTMYVPFHDSNSNEEWNEWRDEVSATFSKNSNQIFDLQNTLERAREQIDKSSATMSRVWDDLQARGQKVEQQAMKNGAELWTGFWQSRKVPTSDNRNGVVGGILPSLKPASTDDTTSHQGYTLSSSPTNSSSNGLLLQSTKLSRCV